MNSYCIHCMISTNDHKKIKDWDKNFKRIVITCCECKFLKNQYLVEGNNYENKNQ